MWQVYYELTDEEISICLDAAKSSWGYRKKPHNSEYNKGCMKDEPWKPYYIGNLGELAFSKISGLPYDFSYKTNGDRGDFVFIYANKSYKINVKTTLKTNKAGYVCIKKGNKPVDLKADYFVFCRYDEEKGIYFNGYMRKDNLLKLPSWKSPMKGANHYNIAPKLSDLNSDWLFINFLRNLTNAK